MCPLKLFILLTCIFTCVLRLYVQAHARAHFGREEGSTQELGLCFHCVSPRVQTEVIRLGRERLCYAMCLVSPGSQLFKGIKAFCRRALKFLGDLFPGSPRMPKRMDVQVPGITRHNISIHPVCFPLHTSHVYSITCK